MTAVFKPRHHPRCATLYRYAAGRLSPGMHLLTEAHLAFCPRCRIELQAYEAEAGLGLENLPPEEMEANCLDNLMSKIDEHGPPACIDVTIPAASAPDPRFPENLRVFTGPRGEKIVWRKAGGHREWLLPLKNSAIRLVAFTPGQPIDMQPGGRVEVLILDGEIEVASHVFHGGDVIHAAGAFKPGGTVRVAALCLCVETAVEDRPGFVERVLSLLCGER